MPSKETTRHYIAMWDRTGIECMFDLTELKKQHDEWEKKVVWDSLKGEQFRDVEPSIPLNMMMLRARVNSQRQYEIYEFNSNMDKDDIMQVFKTDPQPLVEWIRQNGFKVYSDYVKDNKWAII